MVFCPASTTKPPALTPSGKAMRIHGSKSTFPETRSWVTFDPTPSIGRIEPVRTGLTAQLQKYAEAMELLWFQYVVGYDKQEQRSLATSLHNQVFDYGRIVSNAARDREELSDRQRACRLRSW